MNTFYSMILGLFRPLIYGSTRKEAAPRLTDKPTFEKKVYYGLNHLDKKLEKYLCYNEGYFIELGANDGVTQSNTLYFEKNKNWTGVLIEPIPHNYLKCLSNRSSLNHFFCNACVSFDYKYKFVEIIFSNLMSTAVGLESDIENPKAHAEIGKQFMSKTDRIFTFGAVAKTLNQILEEVNAPTTIDFLSLDVEGAEIEVLKGLDHNKYRINYICIECRDINKMESYIDQFGYKLQEKLSEHDYLFVDKRHGLIPISV